MMFGSAAISEFSISNQGIVQAGSESIDANFTQDSASNLVASAGMNVEGTSTIASIGVDTLSGASQVSFNFSKSSALTRFATGIAAQVISFDESSEANITASGDSDQSANFTQSAEGLRFAQAEYDINYNFIQTSDANGLFIGDPELETEFSQDSFAGIVTSAAAENIITLDFNQTAGILIYRNDFNVDYAFIQTTSGDFLWTKIEAGTPVEGWNAITHTGDTWTQINASGIVNTWTNKVV